MRPRNTLASAALTISSRAGPFMPRCVAAASMSLFFSSSSPRVMISPFTLATISSTIFTVGAGVVVCAFATIATTAKPGTTNLKSIFLKAPILAGPSPGQLPLGVEKHLQYGVRTEGALCSVVYSGQWGRAGGPLKTASSVSAPPRRLGWVIVLGIHAYSDPQPLPDGVPSGPGSVTVSRVCRQLQSRAQRAPRQGAVSRRRFPQIGYAPLTIAGRHCRPAGLRY